MIAAFHCIGVAGRLFEPSKFGNVGPRVILARMPPEPRDFEPADESLIRLPA